MRKGFLPQSYGVIRSETGYVGRGSLGFRSPTSPEDKENETKNGTTNNSFEDSDLKNVANTEVNNTDL